MLYKSFVIWTLFLFLAFSLSSQVSLQDSVLIKMQTSSGNSVEEKIIKVNVGSRVYTALIENGDTIIVADLNNVKVTSPKKFNTREEYLKYIKYRRYSAVVFPYAKEAIRIFNEAEYATVGMKKRKRKKYLRKLARELKKEFQEPLKRLSKTQGKIMIKMIERELGKSMFALIKSTNGWWKAAYWNQASKMFGYKLKNGYTYGEDPILDIVLMDFDISYHLRAKN